MYHGAPPYPEAWNQQLDPGIRALVEGYTSGLAVAMSARWDILSWNAAFSKLFDFDGRASDLRRNFLWMMFKQERTRAVFPNWLDRAAN
jgi:hypothetical protein